MPLAPPFARLHPHAAEHAGPARAVTVTLPGDLAEWLDRMCADEARPDAQRDALVAFALDAARDYGIRGRWPDPPPQPDPPRFETAEEFQSWFRSLSDADPDEADDGVMEEVVRKIYEERGYPMDQFVFGPPYPGERKAEDQCDEDCTERTAPAGVAEDAIREVA